MKMKKYLLIWVLAGSLALTYSSCSKSNDNPTEKPEENSISKISFDRQNVGLFQLVTCKVEKPNWAGEVVSYKWQFTNSKGEIFDRTTTKNEVEFSPQYTGTYKVKVTVASKAIEKTTSSEMTVIDCDFGMGIYGNDKKIIIDAKQFDGKTPETGLSSGFYWPFTANAPDESISFKSGNSYEKYLFSNGKLVGGTSELINEPFNVVSNGVSRNYSYIRFLDVVDKWNKKFSTANEPVIKWKAGITEDAKKKYETSSSTKFDGYGWALLNRDITDVSVSWSNSSVEYYGYLKAMGDNSKYEIRFAIRKK